MTEGHGNTRADQLGRRVPVAVIYVAIGVVAALPAVIWLWWVMETTSMPSRGDGDGLARMGALAFGSVMGAAAGAGSGVLWLLLMLAASMVMGRDRRPLKRWVAPIGLFGVIGGAIACGMITMMILLVRMPLNQ